MLDIEFAKPKNSKNEVLIEDLRENDSRAKHSVSGEDVLKWVEEAIREYPSDADREIHIIKIRYCRDDTSSKSSYCYMASEIIKAYLREWSNTTGEASEGHVDQ